MALAQPVLLDLIATVSQHAAEGCGIARWFSRFCNLLPASEDAQAAGAAAAAAAAPAGADQAAGAAGASSSQETPAPAEAAAPPRGAGGQGSLDLSEEQPAQDFYLLCLKQLAGSCAVSSLFDTSQDPVKIPRRQAAAAVASMLRRLQPEAPASMTEAAVAGMLERAAVVTSSRSEGGGPADMCDAHALAGALMEAYEGQRQASAAALVQLFRCV